MPQTAALNTKVVSQAAVAGALSKNYAANNAGDQVATGKGTFVAINVNTAGTTSSVTLYDGTSTSGKLLGKFSTLAVGQVLAGLDFETGLFAVLAGGAAADVTISYRQ